MNWIYNFVLNNVPKRKFGHVQKTDKPFYINVCRFLSVTFFIQVYMHISKKQVSAIG